MIKENKFYVEKLALGRMDTTINNDQLAKAEQLAAEMAHEIRNPLTTIKGFLQLIKPNLREIGKEEYADIVLEEIERVNEIIFEYLNLVKPLDNKKNLVSLNELVLHLVKLYESESIIKNIKLTTHLTEENLQVYIQEKEIKQVLINLIKNAFEAIEECDSQGRSIDIRTEVINKHAYIHIVDTGNGMSRETMNQLFTPFYTTKTRGTGVGLLISKEIVDKHKGNIYMTTAENKGSKFTIELPMSL
jgi:signal transduction histidine kinase